MWLIFLSESIHFGGEQVEDVSVKFLLSSSSLLLLLFIIIIFIYYYYLYHLSSRHSRWHIKSTIDGSRETILKL